jgi:IS30 family transposase
MPAKRGLTMRQIRHLLRLAHEGVSTREIGRVLGIASSTVQDNLGRARVAGLGLAPCGRCNRRDAGKPAVLATRQEGRVPSVGGSRTGRAWLAS